MESSSKKTLQHHSSTPKKLDIHYLKTITKNFSEDQILGRGGYGIVYKGEQENGEVVAVKKLIMSMVGMDDKQFMNEVQHAMDICHPNIVRLEGYCYQIEKELIFYNGYHILADEVYRVLCFEYLPNGSLDTYLSDESSGLDWHTRYNIIEGICMGLYCLHEGREGAPILHLDLKPSNILLDKNMTPKIADFGLSRLFDQGKTHTCTKNVIGSRGYMAPEYIDSFILSKESDIFSLGVMIVEIVTGHRKYPDGTSKEEFVEVYEKWRTRLLKSSNMILLEEECRQVDQCIEVGLKCMDKHPKRRPNIRQIVEILKRTGSSVREVSSGGEEEETRKSMHPEWRETLNILVSGSSDQSIEALKAISIDLTLSDLPAYIIEDADRLVSCLTLMVQKTFSSNIVGSSSRHRKYILNTLMKFFQIRHLAHLVKKGTLEELVTEMLIWLSVEEVVKMDECLLLVKAFNVLTLQILDNADRTSMFVVLINLLQPLDNSRWPSYTPLELVPEKISKFSDLVVKCLIKLTKVLDSTINDLDLDPILQSIHAFLEPLGMERIRIRAQNDDKPLRMVKTILHELVRLVGSKVRRHLSMVHFDAKHEPIILKYIDLYIQTLEAARMAVPATGETSSGGDAASSSLNESDLLALQKCLERLHHQDITSPGPDDTTPIHQHRAEFVNTNPSTHTSPDAPLEFARCLIPVEACRRRKPAIRQISSQEEGAPRACCATSGEGEFVCKTCGRAFTSFQALGEHRTSHLRGRHGLELGVGVAKAIRERKRSEQHECNICGLGFETGQALGVHMRRHREVMVVHADDRTPVLLELFV